MLLVKAPYRVSEYFKRHVLDYIINSFGRDGRLLRSWFIFEKVTKKLTKERGRQKKGLAFPLTNRIAAKTASKTFDTWHLPWTFRQSKSRGCCLGPPPVETLLARCLSSHWSRLPPAAWSERRETSFWSHSKRWSSLHRPPKIPFEKLK